MLVRNLFSLLLVAMVGAAVSASTGNATHPLDIGSPQGDLSLVGFVDARVGPGVSVDFAAARKGDGFERVGPVEFTRPPGPDRVWLRFRLTNSGATEASRLLVLDFRLLDRVTLWASDAQGKWVSHQAGEDTELSNRQVRHPLPVFRVSVPPGQTRTYYLQLEDEGAIPAPLRVTSWETFVDMESGRDLVNGFFLGALLLFIGYGAFLVASVRGKVYIWFTLYLASIFSSGIFYFWGGAGLWFPADIRPWLTNRAIVLTALAVFWTSIRFASHLLDLSAASPRWAQRLEWANVIFPIAMLLTLVVPFGVAIVLSAGLSLLIVIPVGLSVGMARKGDRIAGLYAASWAAIFVGIAVVYLAVAGILDKNLFTDYAIYAGLLFQFCVFAIALSVRVKRIEAERRHELAEKLAAYERNEALARSFERFVPKAFLDRLERHTYEDIELGQCVERKMTTLFSDVRSFTTLVEHMTPEENFAFINEYLGFMEPAIHQQLGFIDKYIGDAVMALFDEGAGDSASGGAFQAAQAAIGMHAALNGYNQIRTERGDVPIAIGIGLHTGQLMLGTIGGSERLNASVIGDSVNLASRVEGLTKVFRSKTLLSEETEACLPKGHDLTLRVVGRVQVKGKSQPTTIYELLDCEERTTRLARQKSLRAWEAAWEAFWSRDFAAACLGFEQALAVDTDDVAAMLALREARRHKDNPPPEDWDGVSYAG